MELKPQSSTIKPPAERFTGDVYMNQIFQGEPPSRMTLAKVRFTPGARTNWHRHAVGQLLHVTEGIGLVATRDGNVTRMTAGDAVWTSPGEEHWHGATADNFMCHLAALESAGDGSDPTSWLEPVTDQEYQKANSSRT